jgi:hypothetical protein
LKNYQCQSWLRSTRDDAIMTSAGVFPDWIQMIRAD